MVVQNIARRVSLSATKTQTEEISDGKPPIGNLRLETSDGKPPIENLRLEISKAFTPVTNDGNG